MLSRSLIPNQELPIGIITAGLGARSSCPLLLRANDERAPCEDKVVYQSPRRVRRRANRAVLAGSSAQPLRLLVLPMPGLKLLVGSAVR